MPIVTELGEHEGKPIRRTSLEVRNIAGGLHKATKTDPFILHPGERAFIVAEVIGGPHTFKPLDDGSGGDFDAWERVNVSNADTVVIVDEELVAEMIEKQREKNRLLAIKEQEERDEAKGKLSLELGDKANAKPEPPDPVEAHNRGDHKRKRKDCPECQAEVEEAKRIAAEQPPKGRRGRAARGKAGLKSV